MARNKECWKGCGEKGTLKHCWWERKLVQLLMKNSTGLPQKLKNRTISDLTSGYLSKEYENTNKKRYMCPIFIIVLALLTIANV